MQKKIEGNDDHHLCKFSFGGVLSYCKPSLVNQTTPSAALAILHHQHADGEYGHSGMVSVAHWNVESHDS